MTRVQAIILLIFSLGIILGYLVREVYQGRTTSRRVINLTVTVLAVWAISLLLDYFLVIP